jgi:hypothetical protein
MKEQGSIPQGLIEQARATPMDPGELQIFGKKAAAMYSEDGKPLSDAVVASIGDTQISPEQTRRVCEFANQEAFKNEWEKGGSVRNVEFEGGPADPAAVLRELNDGARINQTRTISDYDSAPEKTVISSDRTFQKIFGKYAHPTPPRTDGGFTKMAALRSDIGGAQDILHDRLSNLELEKQAAVQELGNAVAQNILDGGSLNKIAQAWDHFFNGTETDSVIEEVKPVLKGRGIPIPEREKVAARRIPNMGHPIISGFVKLAKLSKQLNISSKACGIIDDEMSKMNKAITGAVK